MAGLGEDLEAFRAEARARLEENHPKSLRNLPEAGEITDAPVASPDRDLWKARIGAAPRRAFENSAVFELCSNAKDREHDLGKVGRGIEKRLSQ